MKLTAEQVEALDVGITMGRIIDIKNLLFIMDSWMNSSGKMSAASTTWKPSGVSCPCTTRCCGKSSKDLTMHLMNS